MRQSFIFGPLAVRKRFSVPRLLMAPPIVPPDLGEEERKRFGRVRKLEITNCFYFSLTVRATSGRHGDSFVSCVDSRFVDFRYYKQFDGNTRCCLGTRA